MLNISCAAPPTMERSILRSTLTANKLVPDRGSLRRRDIFPLLAAGLCAGSLNAKHRYPLRLEQWLAADPESRRQALEWSLRRIRRLDRSIRAWVQVAPEPQGGEGPLSGIAYGAKDIIETQNFVTEYGSPIYKGRRGGIDAAIIRQLRSLGAVLVGKTQTAGFAHTTPPPTRNPRNLAHTPGGSSSGSAAAVAAGMVPFALGTQTGGSVLRPASYCGVTGFKPTHGLFSLEGVLTYARSLDTLGFFTHTPQGMLRLWEALGQLRGQDEEVALGAVEPIPEVEAPMAAAFRNAISRLAGRGVTVQPVPITALLDKLAEESRVVQFYEGARSHEQRYKEYGARLQNVATLVEEGLKIPERRYQEALASIAEGKDQMAAAYRSTPVILVPAATGPAPMGLGSTGDSRMNRPWTALGTPAISLPMPVHKELPMGLQLTAAPGQDSRLLYAALRVAAHFDSLA
jgi:Asp-tRNA(Asn)/Glu-tRNA(Gln) amidotransferase A subunit family amidase